MPVRPPVIKTTWLFIEFLLDWLTSSLNRRRIGYERQGCSRAIDVILHCGRPADPDCPDKFAVHLYRKPSTPRRHPRKRGNAGQKRWVALYKLEKVLRGHADQ